MSNIFSKEESTRSLTMRHWEDKFFLYHLEYKMVQIFSLFHSTFKELSNKYSHAQIRVKTKKLWPRQVGEEKQVAIQKLSRPSKLSRPGKLVATPKTISRPKNCRDQETWSRPKKLCCDQPTVSRTACCVATKNARET